MDNHIKAASGIDFPVIADLKDFPRHSGNLAERIAFNYRVLMLGICALLTVFLGYHATQLTVNASFERMIPSSHPYIKNYFDNKDQLRGLGNSLRIVVENTQGDIFDPEYLKMVQDITDIMHVEPGVDRAWMKSLWTPFVRWYAITERGVDGGPLMPISFDFSPAAIKQLKLNVSRSGIDGNIISKDMKSSLVYVPLLDQHADGSPIDYGVLGRDIESKVRSLETTKIKIHVVGFAKLAGDLIEGMGQIIIFFVISVAIATLFVFGYTRCVRSTLLLVSVSILGVIWLLGLMRLLGYELDPYSILVPFLIFAIGLSHGAQRMNGIMQDVGRGTHRYVAARYTFRRLFLSGLTALLTNVVGFAVLIIIGIPVIRNMAITTSIGVTVLIFTKLVLIPVMLSYIGVSEKAAVRSLKEYGADGKEQGIIGRLWLFLDRFTLRRWAGYTVAFTVVLAAIAYAASLNIQIGDLDAGAVELRPDSRYNKDVDFVARNFGLSSDQFATIVRVPAYTCHHYKSLVLAERLSRKLERVEGVLAVSSLAEKARSFLLNSYEGNPKQNALPNDNQAIGSAVQSVIGFAPNEMSPDCEAYAVVAYLSDHKAATLDRVLKSVESFAREYNSDYVQFLPAAGSAGIEAITNIVVKESNTRMLLVLYSSVAALCFITFRSWRAVVVAMVPLIITSLLCEAIMVWLGIGIKVSTLPVIALGVGVGVDYALYLLSIQLTLQRAGESLTEAYRHSLDFTGRIVALVGFTMAASVITWAWSPIKFQADMGILLAFMFLWNMLGALIMIPALSNFLLQTKTANTIKPGEDASS
ncbi:MAG: MMPL family transporter [Sterolibacterium sp.]